LDFGGNCYNDMTAMGAVRVPEELSVVGFDDLSIAPFLAPPLTTIRQPGAEMGRRAAEILMELLEGKEREAQIAVPGELVIRESTASPR